jgi:serine/threonine protein kinase
MATVHRASIELEDDETREVALKRLLPQLAADKRFIDDFIREGKLAAQLQHPNIVRILELGRIGKTYFIAMDLVCGRSLMTLLRKAYTKRMPAPIGVVIALMHELCDALEHAHDAQIVHRDLTPSNLIVDDYGHLKIIDFGVAKALVGNLQTSSGLAKGKLGYMSMEAIGGKKLDTRADIFSTGVVMWELIATKRLFMGTSEIEIINQIRDANIQRPSVYNKECPTDLDEIVLKALERHKEDRWSSAGEMRDALADVRRFLRGDASPAAVVAWVDALRGETTRAHQRPESEGENTEIHLEAEDMFDESSMPGGDGDELAIGSQRGAPPVFPAARSESGPLHFGAKGSDMQTYDDTMDEPVEDTADSAPKFKEVDTIVSQYVPRKS